MGKMKMQALNRDFAHTFSNPVLRRTLARTGIFAIDYLNKQAFPNDLWLSWGYTAQDMLSGMFLDIIHPEDRETIAKHHHAMLSGSRDFFSGEYRIRTRNGQTIWIAVTYEVLQRNEDGSPEIFIGHDKDVTDLHEAREQLTTKLLENETLRDLVEGIHQSLDLTETLDLVMSHLNTVLAYDRASVQLVEKDHLHVIRAYGFGAFDLPDLRFPIVNVDNPPVRALLTKQAVVCNDLEKDFPGFIQVDPSAKIRSWLGIPIIRNQSVIGLLGIDSFQPGFYTERHIQLANAVARQIAIAIHHAMQHQSMSMKAETDPLTGIANRNGLDIHGTELFEHARSVSGSIGVLLIDIDRFKLINDRYGHEHGDQVLRHVNMVIRSNLRGNDYPVRYGGDEILVFLPGAAIDEAGSVAERIRLRIAYATPDEKGVAPTVSIGVHAAVPSDNDRLHEFIACADRAMYEAKTTGRNRCCVSAESLQARQ